MKSWGEQALEKLNRLEQCKVSISRRWTRTTFVYVNRDIIERVCFQQRVPGDNCFENKNRYVILFLM
jgi:hypothetical protein